MQRPNPLPPLLSEPRNVEMPKRGAIPLNAFRISQYRESGLHVSRLLASRTPGSRMPKRDGPRQSATSFHDSGNHDASVPPVLCLSNPRCLNPQIPEMLKSTRDHGPLFGISEFVISRFWLQTVLGPSISQTPKC
jgi:hypothetical protein